MSESFIPDLPSGSLYSYNERQFQLEAVLGASQILGRDLVSGERVVHPIEAYPRWARPASGPHGREHGSGGDVQRKETLCRRRYLTRLLQANVNWRRHDELRRVIARVAQELKAAWMPSPHTVYAWFLKWRRSGGTKDGFASRTHERGGKGVSRLAPACEALIQSALDELLTPVGEGAHRRWSVKQMLYHVNQRIEEHNAEQEAIGADLVWPAVSASTFYRRLRQRPAYDRARAKHGQAYAERVFWMSGREPTTLPERPMQLLELDHTTLNVIVVDPITRKPVGRPTLTATICVATRMVPGWHLSLRFPRTDAVLQTLRHAMLDKTGGDPSSMTDVGVNPCHGLIEHWRSDRASEMKTVAIARACEALMISYELCPARRPELKPHIERFIKTAKDTFVATLPGATHRITVKGAEIAVKLSQLTLEELRHEFEKWLNRVYAQTPHAGLHGDSPLTEWQRRCRLHPPQAVDAKAVICHTRPSQLRCLSKNGLRLYGNQRYFSHALWEWNRQYGPKLQVVVREDPEDIGHVWAEHPETGVEHEVLNVCPAYARGLTIKAHTMATRLQVFRNRDLAQEQDARKARAELEARLGDMARSRRLRDRKRVASAKPARPEPPAQHDAASRRTVAKQFHAKSADLGEALPLVDASTGLFDDDSSTSRSSS